MRGKPDAKPPVPKRGSSLERPTGSSGGSSIPKPPRKVNALKETKDAAKVESNKPMPNVPDFNQSSDDMSKPLKYLQISVPWDKIYNGHFVFYSCSSTCVCEYARVEPNGVSKIAAANRGTTSTTSGINDITGKGNLTKYDSLRKLILSKSSIETLHSNFFVQHELAENSANRVESSAGAQGGPRGFTTESPSTTSSERDHTSEGEFSMNVEAYNPTSHAPLNLGAYGKQLESMIGSMSHCSFSGKHYDTDLESISEMGSVYDDSSAGVDGSFLSKGLTYYPNDGGDWKSKLDWQNGNVHPEHSNSVHSGRTNFMTNGRHHSMYVSSSRSSYCGDYPGGTFSGSVVGHGNHSNSFTSDTPCPSSLPLSVATIHRRVANPRVPVFDGQTTDKPDPDGTISAPSVGIHRNNSLPRPHSYAAPQTNYMAYRLSLARKRDLV